MQDLHTTDLERLAGQPSRAPLRGRQVLLRPIDPCRDAAELYPPTHGDDEREAVWRYLLHGPFGGRAEMARWLEDRASSEDPHFFAVEDRNAAKAVGMVALTNIRRAMRVIEIGHVWYTPRAQRTRVNTETIFLLLEHAFDGLGCRRVEWKCDNRNERSRVAAVRLGFVFEGVFRQHMIVKGHNRDTAWFAMLDHDWPRIRSAFELYLQGPQGRTPGGPPSLASLTARGPRER